MVVALGTLHPSLGQGPYLLLLLANYHYLLLILMEAAYHFAALGAGVAALGACQEYFLLLLLGEESGPTLGAKLQN